MKSISSRFNLKIYFILISSFLFVLPSITSAGDIVAIVNKDNGVSALTLKDLTNLYKGKTKTWSGGEEVVLFLPDAKSKAMQALAANVFKKKNGLGVSKFYLKAVFQQKFASPPQKAGSTDEAIESVADATGGIAIVDAGEISDKSSIKILKVGGL
jgi:ABC-type phosphate transport system substrate-binding protein